MAEQTGIEWCDSTFNPWIGCTRVSPACDHCYAAVSTPARVHGIAWGAGQPRQRTSPGNWKLPRRWNARPFWACESCGWRGDDTPELRSFCPRCAVGVVIPARRRVFCASLADVFDNEVPGSWRADLFSLIRATPHLDWLLLTKRIGNAVAMIDAAGGWCGVTADGARRNPLPNVWFGATICNQAEADRDIPKLLATPAAVRFLSIEPMLGRVDLCEALGMWWNQTMGCFEGVGSRINVMPNGQPGIGWVIAGGESGAHARPMHPEWVRALRRQCAAAGVPFLFKQWGEWLDGDQPEAQAFVVADQHAHDWPDGAFSARVGKKAAGRSLDGVQHTAFPEVHHA